MSAHSSARNTKLRTLRQMARKIPDAGTLRFALLKVRDLDERLALYREMKPLLKFQCECPMDRIV